MTDPDPPLDNADLAILDRSAVVHAWVDPPPTNLDVRVRFAVALDRLDVDVARPTEEVLVGSGARAAESTRTVQVGKAGRFAYGSVPHGWVRLVLHPTDNTAGRAIRPSVAP